MPTGSLVGIVLPIARWDEAAGGSGQIALFVRPGELD